MRIKEPGTCRYQVQPSTNRGKGFSTKACATVSLIEDGAAAAELNRSPQQCIGPTSLTSGYDAVSNREAVASKLHTPAQIDVLANSKIFVETTDLCERITAHCHVSARGSFKVIELISRGWGPHNCGGWTSHVVEGPVVGQTTSQICIRQSVYPALNPTCMNHIVGVTEGKDVTPRESGCDIARGSGSRH